MPDTARIRELNDAFRQSFQPDQVVLTSGVARLPNLMSLIRQVKSYDTFRPEDDPYGEHDFGSLTFEDQKVFWQIQYFNKDCTAGAEDPASDEARRIMFVLLDCEY